MRHLGVKTARSGHATLALSAQCRPRSPSPRAGSRQLQPLSGPLASASSRDSGEAIRDATGCHPPPHDPGCRRRHSSGLPSSAYSILGAHKSRGQQTQVGTADVMPTPAHMPGSVCDDRFPPARCAVANPTLRCCATPHVMVSVEAFGDGCRVHTGDVCFGVMGSDEFFCNVHCIKHRTSSCDFDHKINITNHQATTVKQDKNTT